jgi:hypothetical protein
MVIKSDYTFIRSTENDFKAANKEAMSGAGLLKLVFFKAS